MITLSSTATGTSARRRRRSSDASLCAALLLVAVVTAAAQALQIDITPHEGSQTAAIQSAIDHCGEAGGGTVTLQSGTYVSGSLFLKSHVTLRLSKGAILKGSDNDEDYPTIDTRIAGLEMKHPAALVNAIDCTDDAPAGDGTRNSAGTKGMDGGWGARRTHRGWV